MVTSCSHFQARQHLDSFTATWSWNNSDSREDSVDDWLSQSLGNLQQDYQDLLTDRATCQSCLIYIDRKALPVMMVQLHRRVEWMVSVRPRQASSKEAQYYIKYSFFRESWLIILYCVYQRPLHLVYLANSLGAVSVSAVGAAEPQVAVIQAVSRAAVGGTVESIHIRHRSVATTSAGVRSSMPVLTAEYARAQVFIAHSISHRSLNTVARNSGVRRRKTSHADCRPQVKSDHSGRNENHSRKVRE